MKKKVIITLMTAMCLMAAPVNMAAEETDYSYLEDMTIKELRALDAAIHQLLGDSTESVYEVITEANEMLEYSTLVGKWNCRYEFNGYKIKTTIEFNKDGTYTHVTYKNLKLSSDETGEYEIEGNVVTMYVDGQPGFTEYEYIDGALVNNDHWHIKE